MIKKKIDATILQGTANRLDGWVNLLTGLGLANKDKRTGARISWCPIREQDAEHLYAQDDMARKIVELIPSEGTREWIEFSIPGDSEKDEILAITDEFERLKVKCKFYEAWVTARLYGGAGVFMSVDDGMKLTEPLDLNKIRKVNNLVVLSMYELRQTQIMTDITNPQFLLPTMYSFQPRTAQTASQEIHASRVIRFIGNPLPRHSSQVVDYWGDSVLTAIYNALRNFNLSYDSVSSVMQDFRLSVLKIRNLADIVTADKVDVFRARIEAMNLAKSVMNSVVIDAEAEGFDNLTTSLTGLDTLLDKMSDRLVAATGIPHTHLLGEGSTGTLSGAGESEDRQWKEKISTEQERNLLQPIDTILKVVQLQKQGPTRGKEIEDLTWEFKSLDVQSDKQKADVRLAMANADAAYIDRGVLTPDEVAESRFGGDQYSIETTIDTESRERLIPGTQEPEQEPLARNPLLDKRDDLNHVHEVFGYATEYSGDAIGVGENHYHVLPDGTRTGIEIEQGGGHVHEMPNGKMTGPAQEVMETEGQPGVLSPIAQYESTKVDFDPKTKKLIVDLEESGVDIKSLGSVYAVTVDRKKFETMEEARAFAAQFSSQSPELANEDEVRWVFRFIPDEEIFEGSISYVKPPFGGVTIQYAQLKTSKEYPPAPEHEDGRRENSKGPKKKA